MASKPNVAFIGLGAMGMGMAVHLLEDGFAVTGFDVNPMALEKLLAMGGAAASNPRECVQGALFVICMVANSAQTEDAFFADSTGAVFGLTQNAIVILCSTVAPGFPVEILGRLHQDYQRPDIQLLDCPVSGGTIRAARGMLTILSSGPTDVLNTAQPILKSMSENLYEIEGGLGAANKVKLVNQHLAGVHIAVSAEAMGLAATLGVNTKEFYQTVLKGPACSWMFENRVPHMLSNDWTPHSAISIFVKDMRIVTSEGLLQDFPLYIASATERLYQYAARLGYEKDDDASLVRIFLAQTPSLVSKATHCQSPENLRASELICQLLETVHTLAAVEALALGNKLGISTNTLTSIISNAAGASESFKKVASQILAGDLLSGCTITHTRNKLKEVMTLAHMHNYPLQLTATTFQLLQQAVTYGMGGEGQAALLKLWTTSNLSTEPLHITEYDPVPLSELCSKLPKIEHNVENLLCNIQNHLQAEQDSNLVVLDDDPTGTQTCHDINVLTMWDVALLASEFRSESKGFFILTNSRALPPNEARTLVSEILRNVSQAAGMTGKKFEVVLRGDSTLRGHFLEEIESYIDTIGSPDAWILAPFFGPGVRYTINDVQYVGDRGTLVPAAKTPFAKDRTFGYRSSNLREWIREKAGSRFSSKDILSVTLEDIRLGGVSAIEQKLLLVPKGGILIVNAVQMEDMLMFSQALLEVRKKHKLRFAYRTGASFVSSRLGIPEKPAILPRQIPTHEPPRRTGALIIAGSYVPKSTKQVQSLTQRLGGNLTTLTVEVPALLVELQKYPDILTMLRDSPVLQDIIARASTDLQDGKDVLVMTSRDLVTLDSINSWKSETSNQITNLDINNLAANALVHIVRHLSVCPRYLLAKGGVTSSDAATAGIAIKRAKVLGQAAPGVPIWWCQREEDFKSEDQGGRKVKWTELPLIIFPGNVGDDDSLADVVEQWSLR
ncbi:Fatty oxidation complex, alpha subunit FadB [Penicillium camemberti]|uniref:Fatty oxidation complex, alpha subunit FadB n=1 Tax=Penicillium camemberti (strain FM 013) TaxID=1429867 RepID=A0A0G4NUR0_PENC3|nr:Fatty oxidation complex, alpha subunit FadB [Penicillium camemberti]